jgi:hypothetical protein
MKLTKRQLKELIKEELEQEGILDKLKGGKSTLMKQYRKVTGQKRAAGASGLAQQEVDVVAALEEILELLKSPGNQSAGQVRALVSRLRNQVQAQVKASPGEPTDTPPPPPEEEGL